MIRKPKAVVFDLGKVLVDFDFSICTRRLAPQCTRLAADVNIEQFAAWPVLAQYETGLITSEQFFNEVCALTGYCGSYLEFSRHFAQIFTPIKPMIDLHAELRKRGVPTYIFSNTNDLAITHVRADYPFFAYFNDYILSYEHRCMKPDSRLYEVVEQKTGLTGPDILYLDDRLENVEIGAQRGWQVIHHSCPDKTRSRMQSLGLLEESATCYGA